jgi:TRAP-type C4-dicarboxylate transport system substrate-binding protein
MKSCQRILVIILLASLLATSGLGAPAAAQQKYTLRLATFGAAKAVQVTSFVPLFTKLVEERSHGRITVQSFPAGSLLSEHAVPSGVENDVADIALTLLGTWISIVPTIGIVDTVFFSPPASKFESLIGPGTPLFDAIDKAMQARGVKLLVALDNGAPVVVSNSPLTSPDDFKGKTVRVYDKPTGEIMKALGAAPSTITVSDVYPALQRGTVSAALGGLEGAYGLREYEVAKYLLDTNGVFGLDVNAYVMNLHALTSLPPDLQKVVLESAYEAGKVTNAAMIESHQEELRKMAEHGMKVTVLKEGTPQYRAFKTALEPLAKSQESQFPAALVRDVLTRTR